MNFSKSQQAFGPQQQQAQFPLTPNGQYLTSLLPSDRASFYQRSLVQSTAIYILSDGTCKRQALLSTSLHLTIPQSPNDSLALQAAQTFYSQNEFAISISTLPNFISWTVHNVFKPSDLITSLAVLYGPPTNPGGGNAELRSVSSMPNLRHLRLIFQDYEFKGLGPSRWLRPSIRVIMGLKTGPASLNLKLQLAHTRRGLDAQPEDIDADDAAGLKDVTSYVEPPTREDESAYGESCRIVDAYRGPSPSVVHILMQYGWSEVDSERVTNEVSARLSVRDWLEEERLNRLAEQDVEML